MSENRDALIQHYRWMRDDLNSATDGLTDEQLTETTLDGWSVKDHFLHLALWDELRASEVVRVSAGHDSAWRLTPDQEDAFNRTGYELRRGMSVAQARWELESSRQRLLDVIAGVTERGLDPSLYGEAGLVSRHETQHTQWIRRWRSERGFGKSR